MSKKYIHRFQKLQRHVRQAFKYSLHQVKDILHQWVYKYKKITIEKIIEHKIKREPGFRNTVKNSNRTLTESKNQVLLFVTNLKYIQ